MYKTSATKKTFPKNGKPFYIVRRKGMSKPPVKLGVDKSHLIEKERTS